ncbi:hypothetical protein Tco_1361678 [Tanacetum coccineum]
MLLAILLDRFRQEVNYKNMPFGATLTQMTIRFHSVGNGLVDQRKNNGGAYKVLLILRYRNQQGGRSRYTRTYNQYQSTLRNSGTLLQRISKTGVYSFQLDELWFNLNADLLRKALGITPKYSAHPFVPPPAGDLPWRTILFTINEFLTGKTSGGDRPRHLVLQMLWEAQAPVIPMLFTRCSSIYLGSRHNIYKRPESPVHIMADDYPLNNLKFVSKGGVDEVFEMPILKDMLTDAIQNSNCYKKYLEMASRKPRQPTTMIGEEVGRRKKLRKLVSPNSLHQPNSLGMHKRKAPSLLLQRKATRERGLTILLTKQMKNLNLLLNFKWKIMNTISREMLKARGKRRSPVTQDASTGPSAQPHDDTSANVVHDTSSLTDFTNDAETVADMEQSNSKNDNEILNVEEEHGEEAPPELELMEEDQARSNPGQSHVAKAGPNPEPMHEDFIATVYPEVHEILKLATEEQVHIENPPSSSGTLSSMKNLEDAFTFGD